MNKSVRSFGTKTVLAEQSFEIQDGESLVLVGSSGSGKTTLLKMLNRLVDLTNGRILIDGRAQNQVDFRELRLSMSYVLQQIALFPNLTVMENIALIPKMKGWKQENIVRQTRELLARVGILERGNLILLKPMAYQNTHALAVISQFA